MTLIVAVNEVGDGIIALANCCGLSLIKQGGGLTAVTAVVIQCHSPDGTVTWKLHQNRHNIYKML
jgi:hypothetical protein